MLKLLRFAKPYWLMLVLAIALLFAQANFDLALPDYLSRIVNTGIQQGGVEDAVPQAIRQSEMNRVLLFMSADDKNSVLADYTLVDRNSADYETYLEKYPVVKDEPIYVLNDIDQAEMDRINPIIAKALLAVSGIEQAIADPAKAAQMGGALGSFDLSKLPPGVDVFTMLGQLPAEQRAQISESMDEKFAALGDTMIVQAAVGAVRDEYKSAWHGYRPGAEQLHHDCRWMDAPINSCIRCLYHYRGLSLGKDRCRHGTQYPPRCVHDGRKVFQHGV